MGGWLHLDWKHGLLEHKCILASFWLCKKTKNKKCHILLKPYMVFYGQNHVVLGSKCWVCFSFVLDCFVHHQNIFVSFNKTDSYTTLMSGFSAIRSAPYCSLFKPYYLPITSLYYITNRKWTSTHTKGRNILYVYSVLKKNYSQGPK